MGEAMFKTFEYTSKVEDPIEENTEKEIYPEVEAIIKENPKLQEAINLYKEKCDGSTISHIFGNANKSALLSEFLGLDEEHKKFFIQAALLHDIGKTDTAISKIVASKNNTLSPEERLTINEHVKKSIEYAKEIEMPDEVLQIIGAHHEENNGNSYPRNKERRINNENFTDKEERISERRKEPSEKIKKIIHAFTIIDQFDALFYKRSYSKEKSLDEGCAILKGNFPNEEDKKMIDLLLEERQKELHFQGKLAEEK